MRKILSLIAKQDLVRDLGTRKESGVLGASTSTLLKDFAKENEIPLNVVSPT